MNASGGEIYVPYAFLAENNIITVYDQAVHEAAEEEAETRLEDNEATIRRLLNTGTVDPRWVKIKRPVIITGGELSLTMLDLKYSAESNYYTVGEGEPASITPWCGGYGKLKHQPR